ncbi:hypothetical protein Tco_0704901 [Tanacetum coccineum]|uniref:Uncharacterized protein n=1 Tax=Tanacetum coccineum TaxID=301880 RepID=A0ABQ4Y312_9ASTR
MYDSWKSRILIYIEGKENGEMLIDSIKNGHFQLKPEIIIPATDGSLEQKRPQMLDDLTPKEKLRKSCDIKATNIILLGLPVDIYTLVNNHKTIKEKWDQVKELMEVTEPTLQEHESKLYDDFNRFTSEKRESIHSYYWRYAKVVLQEEQEDCLADRLEEMDDCDDLQLHTTLNFKADHVEAFDSDCDDEAIASAIFMASLSPTSSINGDIVGLTYDSDILFEVPHYDTYHEIDMVNLVIQEMEFTKHLVSNNDSYDELTSDINVISYADYMVTIKNDVAQYIPPPKQDGAMILSLIEQI